MQAQSTFGWHHTLSPSLAWVKSCGNIRVRLATHCSTLSTSWARSSTPRFRTCPTTSRRSCCGSDSSRRRSSSRRSRSVSSLNNSAPKNTRKGPENPDPRSRETTIYSGLQCNFGTFRKVSRNLPAVSVSSAASVASGARNMWEKWFHHEATERTISVPSIYLARNKFVSGYDAPTRWLRRRRWRRGEWRPRRQFLPRQQGTRFKGYHGWWCSLQKFSMVTWPVNKYLLNRCKIEQNL